MIVSFGLLVNTFLARFLPRLEGIIFIVFTLAFISFMVVLWVLAPRLTAGKGAKFRQSLDSRLMIRAAEVFGTITKGSGWSSLGLSLMSGQSAIMFLIVGELLMHCGCPDFIADVGRHSRLGRNGTHV